MIKHYSHKKKKIVYMKKEINNEQTKEKTLINTLKTICKIFPWSSFMIDKCHNIGLDALFKGI